MTLRCKFIAVVGVSLLGVAGLAGFWLQSERSNLLQEKQKQARNLVAIPYSIIALEYEWERQGKVSRSQAQQRAIENIRALRYEQDNYFWINDTHPFMVMHPFQSQLEGKDLTGYTDPTGRFLFVEMARTVRNQGEGFVAYRWPRPGSKDPTPVPKLSFVKGFQPWGWIIGTGVYIDDIDAAWRASATKAAAIALACWGCC